MSHPLVQISLRRRHAQTVINCASSRKTTYIDMFSEILNLDRHPNRCIGSKVTAILLNGWILLNGGVASGRVCSAAWAAGLFVYLPIENCIKYIYVCRFGSILLVLPCFLNPGDTVCIKIATTTKNGTKSDRIPVSGTTSRTAF